MYNSAIEVWDYSKKNIQKLKLLTLHRYVPYTPGQYQDIRDIMSGFIQTDKRVKYLLYGCRNQRRDQIIDSLPFPVLKVGQGYSQTAYGPDLWNLLGSTDTVINIHYYQTNPNVMEIYRISECELLGVKVISESGYMDEEYNFSNLTIVENINSQCF